jgi:putative NADH-flavin reductase
MMFTYSDDMTAEGNQGRITVFGATGQTGRLIVAQALGRGDRVTAVVRDPNRLEVRDAGLKLVTAPDLTDPGLLADAIEGSRAVFSAIGPRGRKDGPVAAPATESILMAMAASSVRRLVVISAAPVGIPPRDDSFLNRRIMLPLVGEILRPVYEDLRRMEGELVASEAVWTSFRPPKLTDGPLTGRYRTVIGGGVPRGYSLSRADLAQAMFAALDRPETERSAVGIAY